MADNILSEAYVKVGYQDLKNLDRQVDSTGRKFIGEFDKMESKSKRLTSALTAVGGTLATIGVAKFTSDVVGATAKMDSLNRMLVNVEGSQTKANKRFEEFRKLAKEPVLDPMNLSKYYVALKSVNVEADLSIKFMKGLANAMAGVGASNEQFTLAMEQMVQMAGKGKVMGDDLRAIANSFPQIRKFLVDAFGTAIPEDLAKKGVTAIDVMQKLSAEFEKQPHFAGGAQASIDNFKQSLEMFEATLGKAVLPQITEFLNKLTSLMDKFNDLPASTQNIIGKGVMYGAGGIGLLGIASTLGFITKNATEAITALKGLGAVSVASSATNATPALSALFGGSAKTGASFMSGSPVLQVATVMISAGTVLWAGSEIYKSLTRDFTPEEKNAIRNPSQAKVEAKFTGLPRFDIERTYAGSGQMEGEIIARNAFRNATLDIKSMTVDKIDYSGMEKADYEEYKSIYAGIALEPRMTPLPYNKATTPIGMAYDRTYQPSDYTLADISHIPSIGKLGTRADMPSMGIGGRRAGEGLSQLANLGAGQVDFQENIDDLMDIGTSLASINQDWQDMGGYIKQADEKQSQFWKNLEDMGLYSMDRVVDKGMNDLWGVLFGSALDDSQETWKEYLANMLKEYAITLGKMLLEYAAYEGGKWAIKKTFGDSETAETAAYGPTSSELNMSSGASWNHWYQEGSLADWVTPDSAEDKAYKAQMKSYASGGISWRPEIARVGESGPEAHIPLQNGKIPVSINGGGMNVANMNITLVDSDIKDPNILRHKVVQAYKQAVANGEI